MRSTNESEQPGQGLQLFTNQSWTVRTAGTPDNPQFCLADLCRSLGLQAAAVARRLEKGVISSHTLQTNGGEQVVNFVNEDGLYDVILDSRKPEAKAFRKWITSEVLPAIRKTGGYIRQEEGDTDAEIMARALMVAKRTIDEKSLRIQELQDRNVYLELYNHALTPKAQYADAVLLSMDSITLTQAAKELNFRSSHAFLNRCREDGILFRQSGQWLPAARYSGRGFFATRTHRFFHRDGSVGTSITTVVTERGRLFLHQHFGVGMDSVYFIDNQEGGAL